MYLKSNLFPLRKKLLGLLIPVFLTISYSPVYAQNIAVKANIDSNNILLGDWIKYNLEVTSQSGVEVLWPYFPDSFAHFIVVERSPVDSVKDKDKILRKQVITLTCFDSGRQVVPPVKISYRNAGSNNIKDIITDTFIVNVSYIPADTSKPIRPIKPPLKIPIAFKEIAPYLTGFLILCAAVFLLIFYLRRLKKNKPLFVREKPKIPAHITALAQLKELENEKLWQKGEVKRYHIRLTDITRLYIEGRYLEPALESTTPEIIEMLRPLLDNNSLLTSLSWFLELSDLVKFAKMQPLPDENEKCLQIAYEFVNSTKASDIQDEKKEVSA